MEGAVMDGCSCHDKILPNTVRAPSVPLYQLGWLGDDTVFGPPETIDTAAVNLDTGMTSPGYGMPPTDPFSIYSADPNLIPTTPTSGIGPAMGPVPVSSSPNLFTSIAQAASGLLTRPSGVLPPGPSPRVSSVPYGASTFGASFSQYLPTIAIFGVGALLLSKILGGRR
jgi:hypothetical protein